MKKPLVLAALLAAVAGTALAQQPAPPPPAFAAPNLSPRAVASMAAACAMCHGSQGRPAAGSSLARLASRTADRTVDAMREFKEGKREATIMHQIAKGYSDAEVAAIAKYFESQPVEAP
jgi:cytochrome subunit of sulfide dehydrogenase